MTSIRRRPLVILAALAALLLVFAERGFFGPSAVRVPEQIPAGAERLENLYRERRGGVQVEAAGVVTRLLPDDNRGSRHQRFVVELPTGQTLLIAHNIDLAPRIDGLRTGDRVEFSGEYEWNPEGGVIHWTHRDPSGKHRTGWLVHEGVKYW